MSFGCRLVSSSGKNTICRGQRGHWPQKRVFSTSKSKEYEKVRCSICLSFSHFKFMCFAQTVLQNVCWEKEAEVFQLYSVWPKGTAENGFLKDSTYRF